MSLLDAMILAVVQGLTEFLPVSSSAHLVLAQSLLGVNADGVLWEVALHVGTLVAVVIFLWRDVWQAITGFIGGIHTVLRGTPLKTVWAGQAGFRLAVYVIIGSIPAGLAGLFLTSHVRSAFDSPIFAAAMLFITGEILWLTRPHSLLRATRHVNIKDSIWMGLAQAVAILPGISRSGSTIAAGLLRDVDRESAARFSFLLSIPAILGAAILEGRHSSVLPAGELRTLLLGIGATAVVGYLALFLLVRIVRAGRLHYFSYYCWGLSVVAVCYFWLHMRSH